MTLSASFAPPAPDSETGVSHTSALGGMVAPRASGRRLPTRNLTEVRSIWCMGVMHARIGSFALAFAFACAGLAMPAARAELPTLSPSARGPAKRSASEGPAKQQPATEQPVSERAVAQQPATEQASGDSRVAALPASVVTHLRTLASEHPRLRRDAFMKVGDSATASRIFMHCFAHDRDLDLGAREHLRPSIEAIRAQRVPGGNSFVRQSRAAAVGWRVAQLLRGSPSPLMAELRELSPRFAVVLIGGNEADPRRVRRFEQSMTRLVSQLLERGVMPIITTIPPRNDDPEEDAEVLIFNRVLRALAERRALPLVDLHAAMLPLPGRGLASDGIHPNAPVREGRAHGCDFGSEGIQHGMNQRNLLTLERLAQLRAALPD
jgi:hypothetical protein